MLMEPNSQLEENINYNNGVNFILKKSFTFFQDKSNKINKELESLREFIKYLISKSILN